MLCPPSRIDRVSEVVLEMCGLAPRRRVFATDEWQETRAIALARGGQIEEFEDSGHHVDVLGTPRHNGAVAGIGLSAWIPQDKQNVESRVGLDSLVRMI